MAEHASDCALHNAPAMAPGPCSCGASMRFRIYGYDITDDTFRWRMHSRETVIAEVVWIALGRLYMAPNGHSRPVRTGTLIERAIRCGLTANERTIVHEAWTEYWSPRGASFQERTGHTSFMSAEDGLYLDVADHPELTEEPTGDEIANVMAGWFEHWASLPEPVMLRSAA